MKRISWIVTVFAAVLFLPSGLSLAAGEVPAQKEAQEPVYGSQLMTREERAEHRAKMRAAKTRDEREQVRKEHHERMKERAKAQGLALPDEPPARGSMGPGSGGTGQGGGSNR